MLLLDIYSQTHPSTLFFLIVPLNSVRGPQNDHADTQFLQKSSQKTKNLAKPFWPVHKIGKRVYFTKKGRKSLFLVRVSKDHGGYANPTLNQIVV